MLALVAAALAGSFARFSTACNSFLGAVVVPPLEGVAGVVAEKSAVHVTLIEDVVLALLVQDSSAFATVLSSACGTRPEEFDAGAERIEPDGFVESKWTASMMLDALAKACARPAEVQVTA